MKRKEFNTLAIAITMLFAGLFGNNSNAQNSTLAQLKKELDVAATKTLEKNKLHGLSYAIVLPTDEVLTNCAGKLRDATPIDTSMRWMFGSVTKNIVSTTILSLQDEGLLAIDDPVSKYFAHPKIDGEYKIKQLMNHTTNYQDFVGSPAYFKQVIHNSERIWKPTIILDSLVVKSEVKNNGFRYSNTNYLVLGLIIEKVTGNSLNEELKTRFFNKMSMNNTSLAPFDYNYKQLAEAWYDVDKDGVLNELSDHSDEPLNATLSLGFASGNLVSTTKDMAVWMKSLFKGKIISEKALQQMKELTPGTGPRGVFQGYGLGMEHIYVAPNNHLGHSGRAVHVSSVFYVPELDIAVAVAINEDCQDSMRLFHVELFNIVEKYWKKQKLENK